MTERNFEHFLYEEASQLPPAPLPKPWSGPLRRICWGIALNTITLNFLGLNYLLPSIGMVLLWLGFRSLRQENGWFRFAFVLSTLLTLWQLASCVLYATPLSAWMTDNVYAIAAIHAIPNLLLYLALWQGLRGVFLAQNRTPKTGAAGALLVYEIFMTALSFIGVSGWIIVLPIMILWILLIRSVYRINRSLDDAGYGLHLAPAQVNDRRAALLWLGISAVALVSCLLCCQRIPMEATAVEHTPTTQTQLRTALVELGFPEEALTDLTDDEVAELKNAVAVTDAKQSHLLGNDQEDLYHFKNHFIQVQMPNGVLRYYYWFAWTESPKHRLMEGLEITPSHHMGTLTVPLSSIVSGRLLWNHDGRTWQSRLTSSSLGGYTQNNIFFGSSSYQAFTINFSLPKEGENFRGYVTWWAHATRPGLTTNYNANVRYIHQESRFNYPWHTPTQYQQNVNNLADDRFPTKEHLVLFTYDPDLSPN